MTTGNLVSLIFILNICFSCGSVILAHLAVKKFSSFLFRFQRDSWETCKEQQISFGISTKYSDFIDGKYILLNKHLKGPYCSKKIASSKKELPLFFTKFSGIVFNWYNKSARGISEKSLEQKSVTNSRSKFVKLFWNPKINYYQVEGDTSLKFRDKYIYYLLILKRKADCLSCYSLQGTF